MSYPQNPQQGYQQQGYPQQQPGQGGYPVQMPQQAAALAGLQMKRRNPVGAWLGLPIITLGIYGLVWTFKVHAELARYDRRIPDSSVSALMSMLFGWITLGIWPIVVWVQLAGKISQAQRSAGLQPSCSGGLGFILGLFGFGVLYYQIELNKVIDRYNGATEGAQVPLAA
jgi:hypothetical protein